MPFVGDDAVQPGRKRRWNGTEDRAPYGLYSPEEPKDFFLLNQRPEHASRKILPLTKRARIADDDLLVHDDYNTTTTTVTPTSPPASPNHSSHRRRRSSQLKHLQVQPVLSNRRILAPCHICHRKPTKKSDLDSFAECQGCSERTCFVCIRECQGWNLDETSVLSEQEVLSRSFHMNDVLDEEPQTWGRTDATPGEEQIRKGWDAGGHRAVVCSRCCIERGTEGDVACLGCFSRTEGA